MLLLFLNESVFPRLYLRYWSSTFWRKYVSLAAKCPTMSVCFLLMNRKRTFYGYFLWKQFFPVAEYVAIRAVRKMQNSQQSHYKLKDLILIIQYWSVPKCVYSLRCSSLIPLTLFISPQMCFNCRKPGHGLADCPEADGDEEMGRDICYRCGSTEHEIHKCRAKVDPALGEDIKTYWTFKI